MGNFLFKNFLKAMCFVILLGTIHIFLNEMGTDTKGAISTVPTRIPVSWR